MIDDSGAARLDLRALGDIDNYRYSAPETRFPKYCSESVTPITYEKDMYTMGMIIYEASSYHPGSSGPCQCKTLPYSRS